MSGNPALSTDENVMREYLASLVPEIYGRQSAIAGIQRRRSDRSSSYASDIVLIQLTNGHKLTVFLKDFGTFTHIKDGMQSRRERELCVYRDLYAGADLGTAKYYGSVWDKSQGRFWLFLEFVNGVPVRYCEVEYWVAAMSWLGRMQGYFAQHSKRLNACDFLLRYDADFFWSKAELALRAVSQISTPLAERLANILKRYKLFVAVMVSQPPTLVHGHYRPKNILVNRNSEPVRVCPIDWEVAAFGPPLFDFAFLSEGFEPPMLDRLGDAYREEATKYKFSVPAREELRYIVKCLQLHRIMHLLGYSSDRNFPETDVARLVNLGHDLSNLIT